MRISKTMTLIQERAGGNELPEIEAGQPICPATPQLRANIVPRLGDFFDLLGKRQRQLVFGSAQMKRPLAKAQPHEVLGSIQLLGQRARSRDGLAYIRRRKTFCESQCRSERELQVQLLLPAPRAVWQTG